MHNQGRGTEPAASKGQEVHGFNCMGPESVRLSVVEIRAFLFLNWLYLGNGRL